MSNLSPGLNARFANIELETPSSEKPAARPSRKQYPSNLYPENHTHFARTTPSKAPRLSTAARAESRSSSSTRNPVVAQKSANPQKRNLHSAQSKEDRNTDASHEGKHTKYEHATLSFMKDTTSSRKKQSALPVADRSHQTRSSSHSDIYTRRNHHYAALATKKRQVSRSAKSAEAPDSGHSATKVPFADKPTIFTSYSPSRNVSAGHAPRSREDVYTRLYEGSKRNKSHGHTAEPGAERKRAPRSGKASPSNHEKPSTIREMYRVIHKADPGFFSETSPQHMPLEVQKPTAAVDLINSREGQHLSVYERGEIMRNASVYYVPKSWKDHNSADINVSSFKNNYGFDDADGNYIIRPQDHIEYRYEIVRVLGTGSFGNVVHCRDHKYACAGRSRNVAIKLIKNHLDWSLQAVSEIKMLKHLMAARQGKYNDYIMDYCDHFHFRGHMCIVSEVLSLNLYTFLELGGFRGVSLSLVKNFAFKILKGLQFVHDQKVIHCDIKPENIMMRLPHNFDPSDISSDIPGFDVKLIDFGSSCFESETSFSYIQSRFYRAPEVVLGAKYSYEIDIWSFGCVLAELFTGVPLLPGRNELEQIALILEMFGAPPSAFILAERKRLLRFVKMDTHRKLNDPLVADATFAAKPSIQVDEKKLRKTMLYTLFNLEGKINLQFLNLQLQAAEAKEIKEAKEAKDAKEHQNTGPHKRNVKVSARSLDVCMRLPSSGEDKCDQQSFSRFMGSVFQWNPASRPGAGALLESAFLQDLA